jgi:PAS domain S-box-containing protein
MLAGGLVVAVVGLTVIQFSATTLFKAQLAARAQILTTVVNHALMKPHSEAEMDDLLRHILRDEPDIRAVGVILREPSKGAVVTVVTARPGQEAYARRMRGEIQDLDWRVAIAGHWVSNGDFEIAERVQLSEHSGSGNAAPMADPAMGPHAGYRSAVIVRLDPAGMRHGVNLLRAELVAGFLVLLFGGIGLVYLLLQRQVLQPLNKIAGIVQRHAAGDRKTRVPESQIFELGQVARAINGGIESSDRRLGDFTESGLDWFWEMDAELRFTHVSDNVKSVIGIPAKSQLRQTEDMLVHEDFDPAVWSHHHTQMKARLPVRDFIYRRKSSDDTPHWTRVSGKPLWDRQGRFTGYRGIASDATEMVQSEDELRRQESRWANVLQGTSAGLWVMEDGHIFASPNIEKWLGMPEGTLQEFDFAFWLSYIHPDEQGAANAALMSYLKGETEVFHQEFRVRRHDEDSYIWVECRGRGDNDGNGNITHMAGSMVDITERKANELALHEAMRQAQLADSSKTTFLANMSHELRTPLNAIIGFSEALQQGIFGDLGSESNTEYVGHIHENGGQLLNIVNDILDMTRIEAGNYALSERELSIAENIKICRDLLDKELPLESSHIQADIPPGIPALLADERAFRQILLNIISNGMKFSPESQDVDIFVRSDAGNGVTISIQDEGIGMGPEELAQAMQPFAQVDSGLTRNFQGTGLGLSIAKALMELHGGALTIESEPGVGTVVHLHFPEDRVRDDGQAQELQAVG